ncbi:metal binding domain of Ada-domain-containing protein [Aspergillus cavernicola]|uniref:Metal binding domain of Ada-domain-containing protein n=1 Tax=Aspergillus cavernicola TaxID=176166 RepID=A0ABR4I0L7_9EURO
MRPQLSSIPPPSPPSYKYQTPHSRWHALTHRTPQSHTSFLYGVKSTKIYCRPTCTARLARRANVIFYDTVEEARRDGFRPCRRCQPDNVAFVGEGEEVVARVMALLVRGQNEKEEEEKKKKKKRGLKEVAGEVGVSPSWLARVFKRVMGSTVGEYLAEFERGPRMTPSGDEMMMQVGDVGGSEEFDLDEWFWTEEFLNDRAQPCGGGVSISLPAG